MFENYPKRRPPLSNEIKEIYSEHYQANREGLTTAASLSKKMEGWLHRQVAKDVNKEKDSSKATLEVGAGTLNQLQYEPYVETYDIVEPFKELFKNSSHFERLRNIYSDISEVPECFRYDRITSIATLEHVCNLPVLVARCGLLLADNGVFRASVPNEGSLLWSLGWKLTTGFEFKIKYGLDYGLLMQHEHVNTSKEIEVVLKYFFKEIKCNVFGLSKAVSLYHFYECRNPQKKRCIDYSNTIK